MYNVLVVEDDVNILKLMSIRLTKSGFNVLSATNGKEGLEVLKKNDVDIAVVDIMMPVMDGFEMVEHMRAEGKSLPIIFVTAKEGIDDKRTGFNVGADDYMVKPIDHEELVLRINALLKRVHVSKEKKLVVGDCTLDYESLSVFNSKGDVELLSKKEFLILYKLLNYPERIFTKNQLMDEFWSADTDTAPRAVDVYMTKLRTKLSDCDDFEIITVHGLGYKVVLK